MCTLTSGPAGSGSSDAGGATGNSSGAALSVADSGSTTARAATRRATPAAGAVIDGVLTSGDALCARSLLRVAVPRLAAEFARRAEGWFPADGDAEEVDAEDGESAASAPRPPLSEVSAQATAPVENMAAPTPRATANPPTRPTKRDAPMIVLPGIVQKLKADTRPVTAAASANPRNRRIHVAAESPRRITPRESTKIQAGTVGACGASANADEHHQMAKSVEPIRFGAA